MESQNNLFNTTNNQNQPIMNQNMKLCQNSDEIRGIVNSKREDFRISIRKKRTQDQFDKRRKQLQQAQQQQVVNLPGNSIPYSDKVLDDFIEAASDENSDQVHLFRMLQNLAWPDESIFRNYPQVHQFTTMMAKRLKSMLSGDLKILVLENIANLSDYDLMLQAILDHQAENQLYLILKGNPQLQYMQPCLRILANLVTHEKFDINEFLPKRLIFQMDQQFEKYKNDSGIANNLAQYIINLFDEVDKLKQKNCSSIFDESNSAIQLLTKMIKNTYDKVSQKLQQNNEDFPTEYLLKLFLEALHFSLKAFNLGYRNETNQNQLDKYKSVIANYVQYNSNIFNQILNLPNQNDELYINTIKVCNEFFESSTENDDVIQIQTDLIAQNNILFTELIEKQEKQIINPCIKFIKNTLKYDEFSALTTDEDMLLNFINRIIRVVILRLKNKEDDALLYIQFIYKVIYNCYNMKFLDNLVNEQRIMEVLLVYIQPKESNSADMIIKGLKCINSLLFKKQKNDQNEYAEIFSKINQNTMEDLQQHKNSKISNLAEKITDNYFQLKQ